MTEHQLLGVTAWGTPCGMAVLKATAEDFQVSEVLDIELSGSGEHLWLWTEKRNLNTEEAVRILAKAYSVAQRQIGYAGLKDRQALTRQWFSVHLPGREVDVACLQHPQLKILDAQRHQRKLQRGAHSANRFVLRLSSFSGQPEQIEQRLQQLAHAGVPNYFGLQRFGYQGRNLEQARSFAADESLPRSRNLRSRLLSTARSALFNKILARRVADGSWNQVLRGDALSFTGSRSFFLADEQSQTDSRLEALDLHPTAALWGQGELPVTGQVRELEQELADSESALCHWLEHAGLKQERRSLRMPVRELNWHWPEPDCLELEFVLATGCYATAVVRELVGLKPVEGDDLQCES